MEKYILGTQIPSWRNENAQVLTFVVTQDCNLRCKYCYMVGKNEEQKMTLNTAKRAIDYFIDNKNELFREDYIILDFIGGEPLMEIELMDEIVDYFKVQIYLKKSVWFGKYRISISTNGIMYSDIKVQRFIKKNDKLLSIGISIDGTKEKHDLQRVFPDGSGSYESVIKNIKLWKAQFPEATTKVTIGHDDLQYLSESIIHLWKLGIEAVPANVVFEDIWQVGDCDIFENQLKQLADYIIEYKLWNDYNTTLFSDTIGYKSTEKEMERNFCGTGKAYTVDSHGVVYPCVRYLKYSLENKEEISFGNIYNGIDFEKTRPFYIINAKNQSEEKCLECEISTGCAYCQAFNYDVSKMNTNFERATTICDMHKVRCRVNNYYWSKLYNLYGISKNTTRQMEKKLFFILSDNSVSICNYSNNTEDNVINMDKEILFKGLEFAYKNFYQPVFIHSYDSMQYIKDLKNNEELKSHIVLNIAEYDNINKVNKDTIYVFNKKNINYNIEENIENCILLIENKNINDISLWVKKLFKYVKRINLKIDIIRNFDIISYKEQLNNIYYVLCDYYNNGIKKELDIITDRIFVKEMDNCFAGEKDLTLSPNGNIYICPAFYYNNENPIGNIFNNQFDETLEMTKLKRAPLCLVCDAYHCNRCIYHNKKTTGELNIPSSFQCKVAHVEREFSRKLNNYLLDNKLYDGIQVIKEINYNDPFVLLKNETFGYEKLL